MRKRHEEESIEYAEDDLMDQLERIAYAGQTVDERHEKIADRNWRYNDMLINGTIGQALFDREVMRQLNFRQAQRLDD